MTNTAFNKNSRPEYLSILDESIQEQILITTNSVSGIAVEHEQQFTSNGPKIFGVRIFLKGGQECFVHMKKSSYEDTLKVFSPTVIG